MTDHLILREATVEGFLSDAYDPEFDSPEALAKWRTRKIYSVTRRTAAYWELREKLEDLWEEVTGLPRDSVETNRGGRLVHLQSDGEGHRQ